MAKTEDSEIEKTYSNMIKHIANKFFMESPRFSKEDLYSEGLLATIKAVQTRPQDTPYSESTWVYNAICMQIMSFVRRNKFDLHVSEDKQKKSRKEGTADELNNGATAVRLDKEFAHIHDYEPLDMYDIIASGEPPPEEKLIAAESIQILREEMACLPERERDIIKAFFFDGHTLRDIGISQGVSVQRVGQIKDRAFNKLQENVKKRYADALA